MTAPRPGRDGEVEAFVVDRYLESLLARSPLPGDGVPADLEATARRLVASLPRFHPSFRFEEDLAARLAAAAAPARRGAVLPFPMPARGAGMAVAGRADRAFGRSAVIGGVLTSAALSLAGALFVARRLARPPSEPAGISAGLPARLS